MIQFLRGNHYNIQDTILGEGQPCYNESYSALKIGDGTSKFRDLEYIRAEYPKFTTQVSPIDDTSIDGSILLTPSFEICFGLVEYDIGRMTWLADSYEGGNNHEVGWITTTSILSLDSMPVHLTNGAVLFGGVTTKDSGSVIVYNGEVFHSRVGGSSGLRVTAFGAMDWFENHQTARLYVWMCAIGAVDSINGNGVGEITFN